MQIAQNAYQRENSVAQKYKFGKQELQDDLDLNWYHYRFRFHDPAVGRFFSVDPLADEYVYNSPYAFAENKLGRGVELEGLELGPFPALFSRPTPMVRPVSVPRVVPRAVPRVVPRSTPKTSNTHDHHFIPRQLKNTKTVRQARKEGFKFEGKENKGPIEKFSKKTGEGRHGNHPKYNKEVGRRISNFEKETGGNATGKEALNFLRNAVKDLQQIIKENPDVKINDLFNQLNIVPTDAIQFNDQRKLTPQELEQNRERSIRQQEEEEFQKAVKEGRAL